MSEAGRKFKIGQEVRFCAEDRKPDKRGVGTVIAVPATGGKYRFYTIHNRRFDDGRTDPFSAAYSESELSEIQQ